MLITARSYNMNKKQLLERREAVEAMKTEQSSMLAHCLIKGQLQAIDYIMSKAITKKIITDSLSQVNPSLFPDKNIRELMWGFIFELNFILADIEGYDYE